LNELKKEIAEAVVGQVSVNIELQIAQTCETIPGTELYASHRQILLCLRKLYSSVKASSLEANRRAPNSDRRGCS